ncbi:MAG: DinB family protein [Thermoplasmata archaeon]
MEEYLFTFMIHEIYHKGEVLAVLWQGDHEPPPVDYWRY